MSLVCLLHCSPIPFRRKSTVSVESLVDSLDYLSQLLFESRSEISSFGRFQLSVSLEHAKRDESVSLEHAKKDDVGVSLEHAKKKLKLKSLQFAKDCVNCR